MPRCGAMMDENVRGARVSADTRAAIFLQGSDLPGSPLGTAPPTFIIRSQGSIHTDWRGLMSVGNRAESPWEGQGPSGPGVGGSFEATTHPVWLRDRCRWASHPSQEWIFLGQERSQK